MDASRAGYVRLRRESVWCDVVAFDHALQQGERALAAQLATGPLLPGFYDDWILTERERLEALREGLPSAVIHAAPTPPETPERAITRQLPVYLTQFFGRETESERLIETLTSNRLVSLIGPGGMGKSRLAVETARRLPLPSTFVPLAELTDPGRLAEFTLQALGVQARNETDPLETLQGLLVRRGAFLLILDNAEHVLSAASALVLALLAHAPALTILVTSRQPLDIQGESVVLLEPLEPPHATTSPARLLEFPAVALFCDRARHAHPDFSLTPRHTEALVTICQRLEGMPLALELAAARTRTQTPSQIALALSESVLGLAATQRDIPERHRSLRAVIQSSVDLLSPELRRFFYGLALFQGGWTQEAVEAIQALPEADTFLDELVQRSLITVQEDALTGNMRFGFLETLRQFANEQCSEKELLSQRHAAYFLTLLARATEHDVRTFGPLESDLENLLAALERGGSAPTDLFWQGLTGFLTFSFIRGHHRRATPWAERAVDAWRTVEPPALRFELLHRALMLYNDLGRWDEMDQLAQELRTEALRHQAPRWALEALTHQSYTASQRKRHEDAVGLQRVALDEARALGDPPTLVRALVSLNRVLNPLAEALTPSDPKRSKALWQEAEAASREALLYDSPHSRYQANIGMGLFLALDGQGRLAEAYAQLKFGQHWALQNRSLAGLMYTLYFEQGVELRHGSPERAALLSGAFSRLREQMGYAHPHTGQEETWQVQLRESISSAAYERQIRLAYQLPLEVLVVPRTWDELTAGKRAKRMSH
nr:AAA family ATPase [Armatimonas rosea]